MNWEYNETYMQDHRLVTPQEIATDDLAPLDHVWILTDETHCSHDDGYSCAGVFSSKAKAIEEFTHERYGEAIAAQFDWWQSNSNPDYFEAWGPDDRRLLLILEKIDEH